MLNKLTRIIFIVFVLIFAASCSQEKQNQYSQINERGFKLACSRTVRDTDTSSSRKAVDNPLLTQVCDCTWEKTQKEYTYDQFVVLDNSLLEKDSELPAKVNKILSDCVIDVLEI